MRVLPLVLGLGALGAMAYAVSRPAVVPRPGAAASPPSSLPVLGAGQPLVVTPTEATMLPAELVAEMVTAAIPVVRPGLVSTLANALEARKQDPGLVAALRRKAASG